MDFTIKNIEDWQPLIIEILPKIQHNILLLKGNLGAGKTTFTKKLLEILGSADEVNSPTYSIVNEYLTPKGKVYHFDLYRLNSAEEVAAIGMEEYLEDGALSIIEWPEIYEDALAGLPIHQLEITTSGAERHINFK